MRVEVISATEKPVEVISRAAGTCYGKDNASRKRMETCYNSGHLSVFEHAVVTLRIEGISRACMAQLTRHRMVSFCVSGDTEIRSVGQKKWSVRQLYEWQSDEKRRSRVGLINVRSCDEATNTIVPNRIKHIYKTGEKPVYRLTTESGRSLKCTADHRIYTPDGYIELQNLSVGDCVFSNGKELLENEDWLRHQFIELNKTRKEIAENIGCCESYVYRAFKKFGIKKDRSAYPNRKPGYGKKGMHSEENRRKISERKSGENSNFYVKDRSKLTIGGGYCEANAKFDHGACELCGSSTKTELHHINKNPRDNRPSNVKCLCVKCHNLWHHVGVLGVFADKVVSIDQCGVEDVYDIVMNDPYHNFVADGIVVHNCVESQRYCKYDISGDDWYVMPPEFENYAETRYCFSYHMGSAAMSYMAAIADGMKPEDARYLLPEATKTNLVMTCNVRELFHIFDMRLDKAAQCEIRDLAKAMYEACKGINREWCEVMELRA